MTLCGARGVAMDRPKAADASGLWPLATGACSERSEWECCEVEVGEAVLGQMDKTKLRLLLLGLGPVQQQQKTNALGTSLTQFLYIPNTYM